MKFRQYNPNRGLRTSTALDGNVFAVFVLEINAAQNLHNKAHCPTEVSSFHISVIAAVISYISNSRSGLFVCFSPYCVYYEVAFCSIEYNYKSIPSPP